MSRPQMTITERDALRVDIIRGAVDREGFKKLDLHPVDAMLLEDWLPRIAASPSSRTPSEIERIAEDVRTHMNPEPQDPIGFLRNADESRIAPLLDNEDLHVVLRWRNHQ